MILNISGRTDIVAFYSEWFFNRLHDGYVDVRNPFYPKIVNRIYFKNVDAILFCTKNPLPILSRISEIKIPIIFHITITPYNKDIEPFVPDKKFIIETVKKISNILGKENVVVRYDPIFISQRYNLDYHVRTFDKLCKNLSGYVDKIIVSFLDEYKNTLKNKNYIKYRNFTENDYKTIGINFSKSARENSILVHTCFEERNLNEYGFIKGECMSKSLAYKLTGKVFNKTWVARKERKCECVSMVDIGVYNTCKHMCKYCYANFDEKIVNQNFLKHDSKSSLLIGHIENGDIIKEKL